MTSSSRAAITSTGTAPAADVAVGRGRRVAGRVDAHAEQAEAVADPLAHAGRALADAAGEDERVEAAGRDGHRRDRAGDPVGEHLERELRIRIAGGGGPFELAQSPVAPPSACRPDSWLSACVELLGARGRAARRR